LKIGRDTNEIPIFSEKCPFFNAGFLMLDIRLCHSFNKLRTAPERSEAKGRIWSTDYNLAFFVSLNTINKK